MGHYACWIMVSANERICEMIPLICLDEFDVQRVQNLQDAKQLIETYQLGRSQLVFTIAKPHESNSYPVPMPSTNVISIISTDVAFEARSLLLMLNIEKIKNDSLII